MLFYKLIIYDTQKITKEKTSLNIKNYYSIDIFDFHNAKSKLILRKII
jgi:hypothetical protein